MMILVFILIFFLHGCSEPLENVVWERVEIQNLPGFHQDKLTQILPILESSCKVKKNVSYTCHNNQTCKITSRDWEYFCRNLKKTKDIKVFLQEHLTAYKIKRDFEHEGIFTGYYEPLLFGSLKKHGQYQTPLYKVPRKKKIPREQIANGAISGQGLELVWVNDPVDAFFLEIQGSGRIILENGKVLRVGYDGQNGYPYVAVGKILIEKGIIDKSKMNMHTLKAWLKKNPRQAREIMNMNPSYVFFKKLDISPEFGPIGSHGVPLTPERSLAVDTKYIPLGAPLWIDVDHPIDSSRIQKMLVAQDKGGAIKGIIRGDYFWGFGPYAELNAGSMKSKGSYYLLLPKTYSDNLGLLMD
jgi:membrane-bound lytic murein transglycosylase A